MITKTLKNAVAAVAMSAVSMAAFAGTVTVKNENEKEIKLKVISQGGDKTMVQTLTPENKYTFTVTKEELGGKQYFTLDGETHAFVGDKQTNFDVEKNYEVTLTNDTVGTTMVSKEVM